LNYPLQSANHLKAILDGMLLWWSST
jgi:hypothetical protein